jgi:hypothetical protein
MTGRSVLGLLVLIVGCSGIDAKKGGDGFVEGEAPPRGGGFPGGDAGGLGEVNVADLDPTKDNDGDGFLFAEDCDDTNPAVNPGAYDVVGDGVDNDCNGKIDDVDSCEDGLALESTNAMDFARALGIRRIAAGRGWGVTDAQITRADPNQKPQKFQFGIQERWGSAITPKGGSRLIVLSTGTARTPGQPDYRRPLNERDQATKNEDPPPPGWPRNSRGCPNPDRNTANDSVALRLKIRVPTNASSFTYDLNFYTSEYIQYACSKFNDTFVALLKSEVPLDPKNGGNISFDVNGDPINVNSGWFEVCTPGTAGGRNYTCPRGRGELAGTGFENGDRDRQHGATSWLRTQASVKPGEEIEIAFMIWNTGDHVLQSSILLDNWQWSAEATTGPVTDRPK